MKSLEFNTEIPTQSVFFKAESIKIAYTKCPYAAILVHLASIDGIGGIITPELIQQDLLKHLPLQAAENLLKEFEDKGYLIPYCDVKYFCGSAYALTKEGKKVAEKGVYTYELAEEKSVRVKMFKIGHNPIFTDFIVTESRNDFTEIDRFVNENTDGYLAKNGAPCTVFIEDDAPIYEARNWKNQDNKVSVLFQVEDNMVILYRKENKRKEEILRVPTDWTIEEKLSSLNPYYKGGYHHQHYEGVLKPKPPLREIKWDISLKDLGIDLPYADKCKNTLKLKLRPYDIETAKHFLNDELLFALLDSPTTNSKEELNKLLEKSINKFCEDFNYKVNDNFGGIENCKMSFFSAVLAQKETAKSSFISAGLSPELERAVIALKMPEWLNEENIAQDNQARNVIVEEKLEIAKVRKMIQNAKQSIFLQSFLLSDSFIIEELEAAAKRGVWVLILTSDAIEKNNHQRLEDDIRTESYNSLIKKLANFSLVRFHEKAHPKFIVTDVMLNKSSNVGFFSTGNITKSGLEKNEERFVWLNEVQTKQLAAYFINMFQEAPKELNYKANKITRKSVETKSGNTGEFIFLGKKETQTLDYQILTDYIVKAKKAVFATYKLGDKNKFYDIVLEAAKHQVDITIRYNNTYLETSKFKKLGIKLEQNDLLHAKYIDLDYEDGSKKLFILSGNFDKKTSENKYEIIVEI